MDNDLEPVLRSWERQLRASNVSNRTVEAYLETLRWFGQWLDGRPPSKRAVTECLATLLETRSASTAETRYRRLRQFDRWLTAEDEEYAGFMDGVPRPVVLEQMVEVPASGSCSER